MATAREEQKRVQDRFVRLRNELPLWQAEALDQLYRAAMMQGAALAIGEACKVYRGTVDPVGLARRVEPLVLRSAPARVDAVGRMFEAALGHHPIGRGRG